MQNVEMGGCFGVVIHGHGQHYTVLHVTSYLILMCAFHAPYLSYSESKMESSLYVNNCDDDNDDDSESLVEIGRF